MVLPELSLIPPLTIPGPFVVLQGNVGDGISNTIDGSSSSSSNSGTFSLPVVPRRRNRRRHRNRSSSSQPQSQQVDLHSQSRSHQSEEEEQEEVNEIGNESINSNGGDDTYHHVPRTTGATVAAGSRFAVGAITAGVGVGVTPTTNTTTTTTHADSVVVAMDNTENGHYHQVEEEDDDDDNDNNEDDSDESTSAEDRLSIEAWKIARRQIEVQQRNDWNESLQQVVPNTNTNILNHSMMRQSRRRTTTSGINTNNIYWWETNGNIAILRELPTQLRYDHTTTHSTSSNGFTIYIPSIIGTLSPGETIYAINLIELHSTTLLPFPSSTSTTNNNNSGQHQQQERHRHRQQNQQQQSHHSYDHDQEQQYPHLEEEQPQRQTRHRIFAQGRKGIIQMIQVETKEGRRGYACLNLDGYPLLVPGLPQQYINIVGGMNHNHSNNNNNNANTVPTTTTTTTTNTNTQNHNHQWIWRVTCPSGAYVRQGIDLNTQHSYTLPYGSLINVSQRCINAQGLSRLRIQASIMMIHADDNNQNHNQNQNHVKDNYPDDEEDGTTTTRRSGIITGWCSELLNPLSGQRGIIAQPVPFPVPAFYRVTLPIGAVIRQDVELSSPQVGVAAFGSIVKISGRAYSEHPTHQCLERLSLVGKGGWISVRLNRPPPDDDCIVEFVGVDHTYDPESPGMYHLHEQRQVLSSRQQQQQQQRESTPSRRRGGRRNNVVSNDTTTADELSSVDENDHTADAIVDDYNEYDLDNVAVAAAAVAATRPTDYLSSSSSSSSSAQSSPPQTTTTNNNDNTNNDYSRSQQQSQSHTQLQPQHSQQTPPNHNNTTNHNHNPNQYSQYCVVCLTSERNATIVHGTTGHVVCCLVCARILQARGDKCPVCRMEIDMVIQHFYA